MTTTSRTALRCVLVVAVLLAACAVPPRRPLFSGAVQNLEGVSCPEDRIRVVEWDRRDGETTYLLDACGTKLEVVNALVLPTRRSEITEISSENPVDDWSGPATAVPEDRVAIVRQKVQGWCLPEETIVDPEAIQFITNNPTACREQLLDTLVAVRSERDEKTGELRYWFRMGKYLFAARENLYAPHSKKVASARYAPAAGSESNASGKREVRPWTGRVQLGPGYLWTPESDGFALTLYGEIGPKLGRDVALVFVFASHHGYNSPYPDRNPSVLQIGATAVYYPIAGDGMRIEAGAAGAGLAYGFGNYEEAGGLVTAGIGNDFGGPRLKTLSGGSWTGFSLTLRGMYFAGDDAAFGGGVYFGFYAW